MLHERKKLEGDAFKACKSNRMPDRNLFTLNANERLLPSLLAMAMEIYSEKIVR
jgi:hypothetical protein